jgi:hypothetical protein
LRLRTRPGDGPPANTTQGRAPGRESPPGTRAWIPALVLLAAGLLGYFLLTYPVRGYGLPVGPDAPVYLWWARLAGHDGLAAVGTRPGVPALTLVLSGTLGISELEVLAGLGAVLGTMAGLAAAALAGPAHRAKAVLAGVLAGTFAVHLAGGYFANLAVVALFLAAGAALATGTRRGVWAAAALLGAGGLAHPLFFALALVILAIAAGLSGEPGRILAAAGGAALLVGAGLLSLLPGPSPLSVDTSKDAFLRRAGLAGPLRSEYFSRLGRHWAEYVLPVSVPMAGWGLRVARGFLGGLLRGWAGVTLAGIAIALVTARVPAVRFLAFAYVLPIGAAVALPALGSTLSRRTRLLAVGVVGTLAGLMLLGATLTWWRERPFVSALEVRRVASAARVAAAAPPGTPLVFIVNDDDADLLFLATRAGNLIRAGVPPDRIRDVFVYVGTPQRYLEGEPTLVGDVRYDAMSRLYLQDIRSAGGTPLAFVLAPFNRPAAEEAGRQGDQVAPGVAVLGEHPPPVAPDDPVEPSTPWRVVLAAVSSFALLGVSGLGWGRAALGPGPVGLALSPSFGLAGAILASVALDRLGMPLSGPGGLVVSALVAAGGFLAWFLLQRRTVPEPAA